MLILVINIIIIFFVAALIYKKLKPALTWRWYSVAFFFKIVSGLLLGAMYFYYYELGDTISFHQKASTLADLARSDFDAFVNAFLKSPTGNYQGATRTWLMIQLTTLFHIITNNNYWITSCWLSLFSFAGFYYLCSKVVHIWPTQQLAVTLAFLFFPSVVFWSSGVIKETLALGAMGFMLGFLLAYLFLDSKKRYLFLVFLFLFFMWQLKYYIAAIWIITLIPAVILLKVNYRRRLWTIVTTIVIISIGVSFTHPNFYPDRIINVVYDNYQAYLRMSQAHETIKYPYEQPDLLFILLNAPIALFSALFMPLFFFSFKFPYVTAVIENLIIFSLFVGWIFSGKKFKGESFNKIMKGAFWIYIILLAIFLALSVPNYGTLSRFRVSFLPFFIWLILADNYILDKLRLNLSQFKIWIKNR